jgi:adsorption protein B
MVLRVSQRILWVGHTYGLVPGLLSVPRLLVGNILNGLATLRALRVFADSRSGKAAVRWDNTQHLEGIGDMGAEERTKNREVLQEATLDQILEGLTSADIDETVHVLKSIPPELDESQRAEVVGYLWFLVDSEQLKTRAALAQALGSLTWNELTPTLFHLLSDKDSIVRSNAAKALVKRSRLGPLLEQAFVSLDSTAVESLIRVIEQDHKRQSEIFNLIVQEHLNVTRTTILALSPILRQRFLKFLESSPSPAEQLVGDQWREVTHAHSLGAKPTTLD